MDGAFGLWAAASAQYRHLTEGFDLADSWATDGHKWPNVGYDCGIAMVRNAAAMRAAMAISAAYFNPGELREPSNYTPEMSRRARGVELWATLRSLGRRGLAELIERTCRHARRFADGLRAAGYEILNEVVINQVLVSFGEPAVTRAVIAKVQSDGTCWCGGTEWHGTSGHAYQRFLVGNHGGRRGTESCGDMPHCGGMQEMMPDWKALRAEFPALANWTYLNTATYGQMPRSAADAMCRHLARRNELACDDYLSWFDDMDSIRESCARLVHCEAPDIAFVISASTGLAALVLGLPWQSGDEVLTLDDEFPNQLYVSAMLARFGARLRTVPWSAVL